MTRILEVGLAAWGRFDDLYKIYLTEIVCQIERNEADIAIPTSYGCYHGRSTIAVCGPPIEYIPSYWFSRYPAQKSPIWNLLLIFDKISWFWTFLSIFSVSIFFLLSAKICSSYFGIQTFSEEIILSPFRNFRSSNL